MALTVFPVLLFNNGTGSDTAASGAGPATAVTGTAAAHTAGISSTTITFTNSPDLSGVAQDGSAVLWLLTASGRQFSRISTVDNTLKTCVVEDSFNIALASPVNYAIGGKRQTLANADSLTLFVVTTGAKSGWTIELEDDQPAIPTIALAAVGSSSGFITLRGNSTTTRRLLTSATNNVSMLSGGAAGWRLQNLKFTSTAATKTTSYGLILNATRATLTLIENCVFDGLQRAVTRTATAEVSTIFRDCEVLNCVGYGIGTQGGTAGGSVTLQNCFIHDNGGGGVFAEFGANTVVWNFIDCIITDNTGIGINFGATGPRAFIDGCTIDGNTSDGVRLGAVQNLYGAAIVNSQITDNGGYGVNVNFGTAAANDLLGAQVDYNNFGTNGTANTSGAVNGITNGANALAVDPGYVNAGANDYAIGTATKAAGYPDKDEFVGKNSTTRSYVDLGAAQREEAAAGGGMLRHPGFNGNING